MYILEQTLSPPIRSYNTLIFDKGALSLWDILLSAQESTRPLKDPFRLMMNNSARCRNQLGVIFFFLSRESTHYFSVLSDSGEI